MGLMVVGILTYYDQLKYKEFSSNPDNWFLTVNIVNFDIINHECRDVPLQSSDESYETIVKQDLKKAKTKAVSAAFGNKRDNLWLQRDLMIEHFKNLKFQLIFYLECELHLEFCDKF